MALDTQVPRSRRAMLAAALGGLAGAVGASLGRPAPTAAANGDPVLAGNTTTATALTTVQSNALAGVLQVENTSGSGPGLLVDASSSIGAIFDNGDSSFETIRARNAGNGSAITAVAGANGGSYAAGQSIAIWAEQTDSPSGIGVAATVDGTFAIAVDAAGGSGVGLNATGQVFGVRAVNSSGTAILGVSGGPTPLPTAKIGVYGYANQDANARAVYGKSLVGTGVWGNSDTGRGLFGRSTAGTGVSAQSDTGRAVYGTTAAVDKTALLGQNTNGGSSGVQGFSGSGVPPTPDAQTGVQGNSNLSTAANGVLGRSTIGTGVWGDTTDGLGVAGTGSGANSIGVYGSGAAGVYATGGVALACDGPALFSASGKKTITSGSSTTVTVPGGIAAASIGLAVLQTNRSGVWVRAVTSNAANGTITIYLNTSVSASTTIGWFVIN